MDSKDLYAVLLGLKEPWTVWQVDMDVARQEITVTVEHPPKTRFRCRNAIVSSPCLITRRHDAGVTWTVASS